MTPAQALRDPDFEFNVAVWRGHREARRVSDDAAAARGAAPSFDRLEEEI